MAEEIAEILEEWGNDNIYMVDDDGERVSPSLSDLFESITDRMANLEKEVEELKKSRAQEGVSLNQVSYTDNGDLRLTLQINADSLEADKP